MGLVQSACSTGEIAPVDRSDGVDRERGGGEAVGARQPFRRDADELLEPRCQMSVTTQPSAYSAVSMSVPAWIRIAAPRLTKSIANGIGGSVSRAYGGAPSRY